MATTEQKTSDGQLETVHSSKFDKGPPTDVGKENVTGKWSKIKSHLLPVLHLNYI